MTITSSSTLPNSQLYNLLRAQLASTSINTVHSSAFKFSRVSEDDMTRWDDDWAQEGFVC